MHEPEATVTTGSITSSLVLAADDPAALARFYGALLGAQPLPGLSAAHWRVPWPAGGWLEVYAPSRNRPQPRQQGRLALCLQRQADGPGALAVLEAWISTALELDATVDDPPRQEPFGAEAWLLDPEGNPIGMLVGVKLLLLAATAALALHARLRLIPNLTDDNLSGLAWHIRGITALAIAFVVVGALIRLGGVI